MAAGALNDEFETKIEKTSGEGRKSGSIVSRTRMHSNMIKNDRCLKCVTGVKSDMRRTPIIPSKAKFRAFQILPQASFVSARQRKRAHGSRSRNNKASLDAENTQETTKTHSKQATTVEKSKRGRGIVPRLWRAPIARTQ